MRIDPDDPLKELEAALQVEPSPEFAAKVRRRVASVSNEPRGLAPFRVWLWSGGLVAAAAIALVVIARPHVNSVAAPVVPAVASTSVPVPLPPVASTDSNRDTAGVVLPVKKASGPARVVQTAAHRTAPEVLISKDQARAFNRLLDEVAAGRTDFETVTAPVDLPNVTLTPVRIEIIDMSSDGDDGQRR